MVGIVRIKRRLAAGGVGTPTSLANAELAYNEASHTLYYGEGTGGSGGTATSVVPIGGSGAFLQLNGGTINSALGGWSSANYGKQLLLTGAGNNPALGVTDSAGANLIGIINNAGVLRIADMPAYANSTTAPVNLLSLDGAGSTSHTPWTFASTTTHTGAATFGSTLTLAADPTLALQAVTKQYTDAHAGVVSVSDTPPSGILPGALWWDSVGTGLYVSYNDGNSTQWVLTNSPSTSSVTVSSFNTRTGAVTLLLADVTGVGGAPIAGPTFTGAVTLAADPTLALQAVTKQYADRQVATVATIAALRTSTTATLPVADVQVRSYAGTGVRGGGRFLYVSTDTTSADNGGTIIVDASSRRWYRDVRDNALNVMWFGAVADSTTNDAPAIQAAIAALPNTGGVVEFPVGKYAIATTIAVGDGTPSAKSTKQCIVLRGLGGVMSPSLIDDVADVGAQLIWTGAVGGTMVSINGSIQGCGVQKILFNGFNNANIGLQLTSASFGDFDNLSFLACRSVALRLYTNTVGVTTNSMNNRFHNIFIRIQDIANAIGILLDGPNGQPANACLNDFENMFINMPTTALGYGIYLKRTDSNSFRNVLIMTPPSGMNASSIGVVFDYTGQDPLFPCANAFYGIDSRGVASANFIQFANVGTPQDIAAPNFIHGLLQGNAATVPSVANLAVDSPVLFYREWLNQTAALAATNAYLVWTDGLYSIDYSLVAMGGATAGTITPVFGATLFGSFVQNFSGPATFCDNSHVGFTSSGRFTAHCKGSSWIAVQTLYTGITGPAMWSLYLNVTRIR